MSLVNNYLQPKFLVSVKITALKDNIQVAVALDLSNLSVVQVLLYQNEGLAPSLSAVIELLRRLLRDCLDNLMLIIFPLYLYP